MTSSKVIKTHIQPGKQDGDPLSTGPKRPFRHHPIYTHVRNLSLEVLPVVLMLSVPLYVHAGVFSVVAGFFSETRAHAEQPAVQVSDAHNVALLKAAVHADPNPSKGGGDIVVDSGALVAEQGPGGAQGDVFHSQGSGEISVYVVREGDALSQIAEMFGVTANTILWANDLKSANLIRPGDSLIILPISGVRYTVEKGDSLTSIAKRYDGDANDIIAYNGLSSLTDVRVGQEIVIPGGAIPAPVAKTKARSTTASAPAASNNGYFIHPVPGGVRTQGLHGYNGVDIGAPLGTNIRAAAAGEVIISKSSGWNGGYGSYIVIRHANGTQTLYAHTSANYVTVGQSVSAGETIGGVGSTGRSTGSHLHFEVRGDSNPF